MGPAPHRLKPAAHTYQVESHNNGLYMNQKPDQNANYAFIRSRFRSIPASRGAPTDSFAIPVQEVHLHSYSALFPPAMLTRNNPPVLLQWPMCSNPLQAKMKSAWSEEQYATINIARLLFPDIQRNASHRSLWVRNNCWVDSSKITVWAGELFFLYSPQPNGSQGDREQWQQLDNSQPYCCSQLNPEMVCIFYHYWSLATLS